MVIPLDRFSATKAVISLPVWVTPSATTPLSAQKTTTHFLERSSSADPVMPAIFTTISSKRPRLCSGLAMPSSRAWASP